MKKFCLYFSMLAVIVIGLLFLLDFIYTASYTNGFSRNKTEYVVQLKNSHIDYIFLGSSRVENNIDCEVISKMTGRSCINFGLQGSKTMDSAVILQFLNDNKVSYEKVFFQLDYAVNFYNYSEVFKGSIAPFISEDILGEQLLGKLDFPSTYKIPFIRYAQNDKVIGFRETLLHLIKKEPKIDLSNGFEGKQGVGILMKGSLPTSLDSSNDGIQWMNDVEPNNLIFFTAPYCQQAENRELFSEKLMELYPQSNNYLNLFDNSEENYRDCGHLNNTGAQKFSEIIARDLILN